MQTYKDRIAEKKRVDVPQEPENRSDKQVAVRHADASGGDIRENPARREENERHPRCQEEDQGQQAKNNWTNGGRQNDLSMKLRIHQHLPIHVLPGNIL